MKTIFHNPRCGKSRKALACLIDKGIEYQVVEYLKDNPTYESIVEILKKLGISPYELIRKTEPIFIDKYKNLSVEDTDWIKIMVENPILIQRPIIIEDKKAYIVRDEESLKLI
jgi:arsenate reductase